MFISCRYRSDIQHVERLLVFFVFVAFCLNSTKLVGEIELTLEVPGTVFQKHCRCHIVHLLLHTFVATFSVREHIPYIQC